MPSKMTNAQDIVAPRTRACPSESRIKDQMDKAKQELEIRTAKLRQAQQLVAEAFRP